MKIRQGAKYRATVDMDIGDDDDIYSGTTYEIKKIDVNEDSVCIINNDDDEIYIPISIFLICFEPVEEVK